MIGGKAGSRNRPTALGSLLNASTYGQTIKQYYGMVRIAISVIWAANLREGHSSKKAKKKGAKTYVENTDFLLGSNPIQGVQQMWANNTNRYTLNRVKVRVNATSGSITFTSDPKFYWVIGVTAEQDFYGFFNDFGAPTPSSAIAQINIGTGPGQGGTGYAVNDTFSVNGSTTGDPAVGHVTSVSGGGVVTGILLDNPGSGYTNGFNVLTTTLTGGGSGLVISIFGTGTPYPGQQQDGTGVTYEHPLWNLWDHGPDVVNAAGVKYFPWIYSWKPGDGPTIVIPTLGFSQHSNGWIDVYYYQLASDDPPVTFNRMTFEQSLGEGTEYLDAGLSAQQIIYKFYAGLGSSDLDLGSSGLIPDWRVESKGMGCVYGTGDADFTVMMEDILKSGVIQTGVGLGLIQRGVNCNDMPGLVQKTMLLGLAQIPIPILTYYQPSAATSIKIATVAWRPQGGANPTIANTAGNTWNAVELSPWYGIWWAQSTAAPAGDEVTFTFNGGSFAFDNKTYIFETDPGTDTVEDIDSSTVSTGIVTLTVNVAAESFLLFYLNQGTGGDPEQAPDIPFWKTERPQDIPGSNQPIIASRRVTVGGLYSISYPVPAGGDFVAVLFALSQSQPSPIPQSLGNILDEDTLSLTQDQCRANGLYGSWALDSQRKTRDWLDDLGKMANCAYVWSGDKLKVIPWSEVSWVGNGTVYTSPTAAGPVATLYERNLVGKAGEPLIQLERAAQVYSPNIDQIECVDRLNDYNVSTVGEPESGAVAILGPRKQSPTALHGITDPKIAREILKIQVSRLTNQRNKYSFTAMPNFIGLEAMDLIYIDYNLTGVAPVTDPPRLIPVRLTSVKEQKDRTLKIEAQDFIYGVNSPNINLVATTSVPNNKDASIVPGPVNPPIIFEPPTRMTVANQPQVWILDSNSDQNAGGSLVFVSVDGGTSYTAEPVGTIFGNAPTGYVETLDFPASPDPDATNTLDVDLTESRGALQSYSADEENNFLFPVYLGATPTPTPNVVANSGGGGSNVPTECLNFAPTAPLGGVTGADVILAFAKQRDVIGGQTSFFYGPALVAPLTPGPPVPTGGFIRFRQSTGCSGIDQSIIAVYDEHTLGCPCQGRSLPIATLYTSGGGGNGFNYDFSWFSCYVRGSGPIEYTFGALGTIVTLGEASLDTTGMLGSLGGTGVVIVRLWPVVPGNPGLFVAMVAGTSVTSATGWTYVGGGNGCQIFSKVGTAVQVPNTYELATYQVATLVSQNHYSINAAVEPIRRAVFGVPTAGEGIDHDITSRFGFIGDWQSNQLPSGMLKLNLDPTWLNKTLFFKFVPFNVLGSGLATLASATPYQYTPTGILPGGGTTGGGTGGSGQPGQLTYSVSGGELTNPTATTIEMAKAIVNFSNGTSVYYNPRSFTIPAPTQPTTYFITIFDPNFTGDVGTSTALASQASLDTALVGVPGYIYIGSITVLPGGGGTFTTPGGYPPGEQILVNGV